MSANAPARFAADFARRVTPILAAAAKRLAEEMAEDRLTFPEAMAELMTFAHSRGAGYLPNDAHDQLRDWVCCTLLDEALLIEEARALVYSLLCEPSREVMRRAIREFIHG